MLLTTKDNISWTGGFRVDPYTGDGIGQFEYKCTDLTGNIGIGTSAFEIDTSCVVFDKGSYTFTVEREYDQQRMLTVKNIDNEPHTITTTVINPYDDLIVGFIGDVSQGKSIKLEPGEARTLILAIHTQDAALKNYIIQTRVISDEDDNLSNSTNIYIDVKQPAFNVKVTYIGQNQTNLAKTYRIFNYGDTITDLRAYLGDELQGKVLMRPEINHGRLESGSSIEIILSPIINQAWEGVSGYFYVDAFGTPTPEVHIPTKIECNLPADYEVYKVELNRPKLYFDMADWYCINKPYINMGFQVPWWFGSATVLDARLKINFIPRSIGSHDVRVYMNNNEVGHVHNPDGYLTFPVDAAYLNYATEEQGTVQNTVNIRTTALSGAGHYVSSTNVRVVITVGTMTMYVVALNEGDAIRKAWSQPHLHCNSDTLKVNISTPSSGFEKRIGEKVFIKAEAVDEAGTPQWLCDVNASFSNGDEAIGLYDDGLHDDAKADDGVYAGWWCPINNGTVTVTVVAKNCKTQGTDTVGGRITLNNTPTIKITAPGDGDVVENSYSITLDASDIDGDPLAFTAYHSVSSTGPWNNILYQGTATGYEWNTMAVKNGTYYIRVVVSDGALEGEDSVKVVVNNIIQYGSVDGWVVLSEYNTTRYVKGILVAISGAGTTTTDANSYFHFPEVAIGTYSLTAAIPGASSGRLDGIVVVVDTNINIGTLSLLSGDANGDGRINALDIIILRNAFGSMPGDDNWNPAVDFNHDYRINALDIVILRNNFGKMQGSNSNIASPAPAVVSLPAAEVSVSSLKLVAPMLTAGVDAGSFRVEIRADNVNKLSVAELHLSFDPQVVEVEDADMNTAGIQIMSGTFLAGGTIYQNNVDNQAGRIDFTADAPVGEFASGNGVIASIPFRVIAKGNPAIRFDFDEKHNRDTMLINTAGEQMHPVIEQDLQVRPDTLNTGTDFCVYPNPWESGKSGITFAGLNPEVNTTIQIFNLAGELVRQKEVKTVSWQWDVRNEDGDYMASGIYIYLVVDADGVKKVGKVGVIR